MTGARDVSCEVATGAEPLGGLPAASGALAIGAGGSAGAPRKTRIPTATTDIAAPTAMATFRLVRNGNPIAGAERASVAPADGTTAVRANASRGGSATGRAIEG